MTRVLDFSGDAPRRLLGRILREAGVMTQEALDAALMRAQRSREFTTLREDG